MTMKKIRGVQIEAEITEWSVKPYIINYEVRGFIKGHPVILTGATQARYTGYYLFGTGFGNQRVYYQAFDHTRKLE